MGTHIIDKLKEVCIACGKTRYDIEFENLKICNGKIRYREFIKNGQFLKEIIFRNTR